MSVAEPSAVSAESEFVLAVDDNEQNLQLLEEYLTSWGYNVVLARDGAEALRLFPERTFAIVILDVMMPNVDGYETCKRLKASPGGRTVPVLMLTALTSAEDKIRALECGADDFLNKPINREELRARIRSLVRIRTLRRELDSSENIVLSLTVALENKNRSSHGHVQRVAEYAGKLCAKLGMTGEERDTIVKSALLHDIGMIGVPDALIEKQDLDENERRIVADHTRMGASILEQMKTFRPVVPVVRWHHELIDGSGYPDGLKGDAIPLEAQIVGVANRFDELMMESPDRNIDTSLELLRSEAAAGRHDADLVALFAAAMKEETPRPVVTRHMKERPAIRSKVLSVDDNPLNRELIAETLVAAGMDVVTAGNGREAVEIIEREAIDVVLLDLMMPVQDGYETLRQLRSDPRHEFLPLIVVTSQRNSQARQEAILAGADDFISYPLNRLELVTRIHSLLRIKDYHSDLEQTQNIICALALTLEAKDAYTRGHSQRVGDLARAFALYLGHPAEAAERARIAGLLHDIGKIAVPESLLNKRGPLTREEFMRVIDHPVIGEEMVRPLLTLGSVLLMIRHHHERYDGRGYPDGLKGDAIPPEVRLLSIVDAYDALTSHRSYRPAPLTHDAALATLRREAAGGKWDPALVQQFAAMLGEAAPNWDEITTPAPSLRLA